MNKLARDFISDEKRQFNFVIGTTIASALSGFIAGAVSSLIIFMVLYNLYIK